MRNKPLLFLLLIILSLGTTLLSCQPEASAHEAEKVEEKPISPSNFPFNPAGNTLLERFPSPAGFSRITLDSQAFGAYLRNFPLLPDGSSVHYYNGEEKPSKVHAAVLDIDVGKRDLQQCADAVMRLRAEYLYGQGKDEEIHFNFTNGFTCDFASWKTGKRVAIEGNRTWWVQRAAASRDYKTFRKYLTMVFSYAGTASLEKELIRVSLEEVQPGDVFIQGGFPGHAIIVTDVLIENQSGKRYVMLAQSYMPAQEIHILMNYQSPKTSPWYALSEGMEVLDTPEWQFSTSDLKRFE